VQNGTIAHEIGHAVGFWHEQSRPDRNNYVVVHEENISEGKLYNFQTRTWGEIIVLGVPYDLGSGMHYGAKVQRYAALHVAYKLIRRFIDIISLFINWANKDACWLLSVVFLN